MNAAARAALAAYQCREISPEVTLMRLLLACGNAAAMRDCLEAAAPPALRDLAEACRGHLEATAGLVAAGLAAERTGSLAAVAAQFDDAAARCPEAAVALYSLGSPDILDRGTAEIIERLRGWHVIGPGARVLDIGCGIGRIERELAPEIGAIVGIDLSSAMIAEARRRCADLPNVEFRQCGGAGLGGFAGRRFDLVLAVDVFPYLVAADPAIAAGHVADAARLTGPGGALVILNYSYRGDLARDRADVAALAARHGFRVERDGTRDLELWDGATFLLRQPVTVSAGSVSARPRRG
jgi:SAM-dependent methyltransferase